MIIPVRPSKRKDAKFDFFLGILCGSFVLVFSIILFWQTSDLSSLLFDILKYGSLIFGLLIIVFCIIMIMVLSQKPFIECSEIGIDAHGKSYAKASGPNWFFASLSGEQIKMIAERIKELETWKESRVSTFSSQNQIDAFLKKYDEHSRKAFYCYIYRSGTRYYQSNYKKTPYKGVTEYWGEYYSPEQLKQFLYK